MSQNQKTIAENRKARHEYELYDRFEAGLVLQGTEIKSIRRGKVQLKDSYISFQKGKLLLKVCIFLLMNLETDLIMMKRVIANS